MSQLLWLAALLKSQYFSSVPVPNTSFEGQTTIVTGANTGLGFEAAKHFVKLNASRVIIACRNLEKGEAAKKAIEGEAKRTGVVEVWQLDLSSYNSVKAFAARASTLDRIDVLLENAGISTSKFSIMEDNESSITVNVVSTFLLALLMMPKLKEMSKKFNKQPHLVIVSSEVHGLTDLPERKDPSGDIFATLNDKSKAAMSARYPTSKLLEVLIVRAMVEQQMQPGYPVLINYVNPGFCRSELMREVGLLRQIVYLFLNARSTEKGSRTLVHASQAGPKSHGQYMSNCAVDVPSAWVRSEEGRKTGERVWKELSRKLEGIEPGILANL
ncbi:short-chain dehydrogenase/reductase-like protein [Tothia fuscella]|uniref:Short-chain dehydrogenase/reductase-like protein n=1 Tax=Tothia fuscella TaxID=1048955 RepID=A0A9P4U0L6_9PEZI|nr:short-chain dehydrogenase/reductase-like protein [Tothia fuscella]